VNTNSDVLRLPSRLFAKDRFYLPLKKSTPSQTALHLQFPIDQLNDPGLRRFIFVEYHENGFELRERQILCQLVGSDALFVDIGAHFGLFSLVLSEAIPGLRCLAVEPEPSNFSALRENIDASGYTGSIVAVECALGSQSGIGRLRLNSSMGHHLSLQDNGSNSEAIDVQVLSLDQLLAQYSEPDWSERPIWLKIDTEGRESDVFFGARDLFKSQRIQGVLWEFRVGHLENPNKNSILDFLDEFGFESIPISDSNMISVLGPNVKDRLSACGYHNTF